MDKIAKTAVRLAAVATTAFVYNDDMQTVKQRTSLLARPVAQCWINDEELKFLRGGVKTNTYVWGEGYQVDATQEFSNYTPKKIRPFEGDKTPNIVDMAFGWYHEAYIDAEGRLYVCDKVKMSSIRI